MRRSICSANSRSMTATVPASSRATSCGGVRRPRRAAQPRSSGPTRLVPKGQGLILQRSRRGGSRSTMRDARRAQLASSSSWEDAIESGAIPPSRSNVTSSLLPSALISTAQRPRVALTREALYIRTAQPRRRGGGGAGGRTPASGRIRSGRRRSRRSRQVDPHAGTTRKTIIADTLGVVSEMADEAEPEAERGWRRRPLELGAGGRQGAASCRSRRSPRVSAANSPVVSAGAREGARRGGAHVNPLVVVVRCRGAPAAATSASLPGTRR